MSDGVVEEFAELESTGGRKPISLRISPDYAYVISVDIGTFSSKAGVLRINGEIVEKQIFPVKSHDIPTVGLSLDELYELIEEDVYKRQKIGREVEFVYNDKHYSITTYEKEWKIYCDDTKEELLNVLKSKENNLLINEPVSYTHLDVYKRQLMNLLIFQ